MYRDVKFVPDSFPFLHKTVTHTEQSLSYPAVSDLIPLDEDVTGADDSPLLDFQSSERVSPSHSSPTIDIPTVEVPDQVLRRGSRIRHPPMWMQDYISSIQSTQLITAPISITPPTFPYIISPALYKPHISYLFNLTMIKEPTSFKEAAQDP